MICRNAGALPLEPYPSAGHWREARLTPGIPGRTGMVTENSGVEGIDARRGAQPPGVPIGMERWGMRFEGRTSLAGP